MRLVSATSILLFSLAVCATPLDGQTVTIGSAVSIPVINPGNINQHFNVDNGVISQDITVDGNVQFANLLDITFRGITFTGGGDNIVFNNSTFIIFEGCALSGSGILDLNGSSIRVYGGSVQGFEEININQYSSLNAFSEAAFTDIDVIELHEAAYLNSNTATFDNAPVRSSGILNTITLVSCTLRNTFIPISLHGAVFYIGIDNQFIDNHYAIIAASANGDFIRFREQNSDFINQAATPIVLDGVAEIYLLGNSIDAGEQDGNCIIIWNGHGPTIIEDNTIEGNNKTHIGIEVFNRTSTVHISGNSIEGIASNFSQPRPAGMVLTAIGALTVAENIVMNNSGDAIGILVSACPGAVIESNLVHEHYRNIQVLMSDDCSVQSNICFGAEDSGLYMVASQNARICNNQWWYSPDGIRLSGTHMMLDVTSNYIRSCDRGLVYRQDVLTNAQIEKGNIFISNTLGAEFEGVTGQIPISNMSYVVRNNGAEYPSHTPSGWFVPTGTTIEYCSPPGTQPPYHEPAPETRRLVYGFNGGSPDGKDILDWMIALKLIGENPDMLSDTSLYDFCSLFCDEPVDLIPLVAEVIGAGRGTFPPSSPVLVIDEYGEITGLEDHKEYMEEMGSAYYDVSLEDQEFIDSLINMVSGLSMANGYESDYQFAMLQLLGLFAGDTISYADTASLVSLAAGCIADDGPGVYVAQIIAAGTGRGYTEATSCTPVTPRWADSPASNVTSSEPVIIFPNPATGQLSLSLPVDRSYYRIGDIWGRIVLQGYTASDNSIDIAALADGVYILELPESHQKLKFIKQ